MVLADSAEDVAPAAEFVRKTIEPYGRITRHEIERYWKVPELQEIYFLLELTCGACDARWANVEYFPASCLANDEDTVER